MSDKAWVKALKVGDQVLVVGHGFGARSSLATVSRFTKNFIIIKYANGNEEKFRIETGTEPGGHSYGSWTVLEQATPEALEAFREKVYRHNFKNKIEHLNWDLVPLDRLKEIREIVEPYIGQKENTNGL